MKHIVHITARTSLFNNSAQELILFLDVNLKYDSLVGYKSPANKTSEISAIELQEGVIETGKANLLFQGDQTKVAMELGQTWLGTNSRYAGPIGARNQVEDIGAVQFLFQSGEVCWINGAKEADTETIIRKYGFVDGVLSELQS